MKPKNSNSKCNCHKYYDFWRTCCGRVSAELGKQGQHETVVMPNGEFNMNDLATVKLTKEGEKILREHFRQYPALIKIDENKIYETSLWEIMQIFGEHIYNGCTIPFEKNLITIAVTA